MSEQRQLQHPLWRIDLPHARRAHLADGSDLTRIYRKTLCGKGTAERRLNPKQIHSLDGTECEACREAIFPPELETRKFVIDRTDWKDRKIHLFAPGREWSDSVRPLCREWSGWDTSTSSLGGVTCRKCLDSVHVGIYEANVKGINVEGITWW